MEINLSPFVIKYTKINPNCIIDLNVEKEMVKIKLLEDTVRLPLSLLMGRSLRTQKSTNRKRKTWESGLHQSQINFNQYIS